MSRISARTTCYLNLLHHPVPRIRAPPSAMSLPLTCKPFPTAVIVCLTLMLCPTCGRRSSARFYSYKYTTLRCTSPAYRDFKPGSELRHVSAYYAHWKCWACGRFNKLGEFGKSCNFGGCGKPRVWEDELCWTGGTADTKFVAGGADGEVEGIIEEWRRTGLEVGTLGNL